MISNQDLRLVAIKPTMRIWNDSIRFMELRFLRGHSGSFSNDLSLSIFGSKKVQK